MERDDETFLKEVSAYCIEYPDVVPALVHVMTRATIERLSIERQRRLDIETAMVAALMHKGMRSNNLLVQKLEEIQPFSSFNFESIIEDLKSKQRKTSKS